MNLEYLNVDNYGIPEDAKIPVFLISAELKVRKLVNGLSHIGYENSFCLPDLCDLVLGYVGFDDRSDELYNFYFNLLDRYCEKVTYENSAPINEAFSIYKELMAERQGHFSRWLN